MNISFEDIQQRIEKADDFEIERIMEAVRKRIAAAFPDWEVLYLSCPKNDPEGRRRMADCLVKYFQNS